MTRGFDASLYSKRLMAKYKFACMLDNNQLWYYNEKKGLWESTAREKIGFELEKDDPHISSYEVKEVSNKISRNVPIYRTSFNNHNGYVNIKNGMIDLKTGNILEHDPEFYSIYQFPISYNPSATCPQINSFIESIVDHDVQNLIYELFGFLLFPTYPIHKAFILFGPTGHNGKTTIIRLLQSFVGIQNCSNVELQDFDRDTFATASLYGKVANIADDLSSRAMESAGKFKQLTGESPVSAQHKYERRFEFTNHAKLIFACNRIPAAPRDADEPFYRRWIIINFNRQFIANEDTMMKQKITTDNEISGLLNIAIEKHLYLMSNRKFSNQVSVNETKRKFLAGSNDSIGRFLVDCVNFRHDSLEIKTDVYKYYCEYCDSKMIPSKSDNAFFRRFKEYCPDIVDIYTQINGSRHYCMKGIEILPLDV